MDFPGGSDGKASVYDVGDPGSISGLGRSLGEGNGNPLQYCIFCNQKCQYLSEMPNWFLQRPVYVRLQCRRPRFNSWVRKIHWRKERLPSGSDGKASVCNAGDPGSMPGLGRSPGEGNGSPLQYSCLENPMDRGAW